MHWDIAKVQQLYNTSFLELLHKAYSVLKENFDQDDIELCTLLSVKTGACPENCSYCPQSAHYDTGVKKEKLMDLKEVVQSVKIAKENGLKRFCIGAAWRSPPKKDFPKILEMVKAVKATGLESCMTLGMLTSEQAKQLKDVGLDFYNHNLDTSNQFYQKIISTRGYQDRLDTIQNVVDAGINVCCGGIFGMGESVRDRLELLLQLKSLPEEPKSIPINQLYRVKGTPLENAPVIDNFEFIRIIAVTRILFPTSRVRLSVGRRDMSDETQSLCFMAGANSIFYSDKFFVTKNADKEKDDQFFKKLGIDFKNENAQKETS